MTITISDERDRSQRSVAPRDDIELALIDMLAMMGWQHKRIAALFDCNMGRIAQALAGEYGPVPEWELRIRGAGSMRGRMGWGRLKNSAEPNDGDGPQSLPK
jgi:hypothetical protein